MSAVKRVVRSVSKPFERVLGSVKDAIVPEIDTSAQERAAREAAEASRQAAERQAQEARWQAQAAANQQATAMQREQLQRDAEDAGPPVDEEAADVRVGDVGREARRRRESFSASSTSSNSPSIRI